MTSQEHTEHGDREIATGGDVPAIGEVLAEISALRDEIERRLAAGDTPLPEAPQLPRISAWSVEAHRRHWGWA